MLGPEPRALRDVAGDDHVWHLHLDSIRLAFRTQPHTASKGVGAQFYPQALALHYERIAKFHPLDEGVAGQWHKVGHHAQDGVGSGGGALGYGALHAAAGVTGSSQEEQGQQQQQDSASSGSRPRNKFGVTGMV
jgi:hypothetical protein